MTTDAERAREVLDRVISDTPVHPSAHVERSGMVVYGAAIEAMLAFAAQPQSEEKAISVAEEWDAYMTEAVSNAPDPLIKLGAYLSELLCGDEWKTAEQLLNAAVLVTQPATPESAGEDWLLRQLNAWPVRVDREKTINVEYLMKAAAKRIVTLQRISTISTPLPERTDALREALDRAVLFSAYNPADPLALRFVFSTETDRLAAANAFDVLLGTGSGEG